MLLLLATTLSRGEEASPHVAFLQSAGFKIHPMGDGGFSIDFPEPKAFDAATLAHIAALGDVRRLSGNGEGIDDTVLARLAKAAPVLEYVFINGSALSDAGLAALATLPALKHFGLHHGPKELKGKGLLALKGNKHFTSIEFGGMASIDDETVGYLAQLPQLRSVNIYHTLNTRTSLPLLVQKLPLLESFALNPHFEPTRFSAADIAALSPLKNLRELALNDLVLPYENGLIHLKALTGLKKLSVEWSFYTDEDLARLRAALPGVEIKAGNRAAEDKLALWNERVEEMNKAATKRP